MQALRHFKETTILINVRRSIVLSLALGAALSLAGAAPVPPGRLRVMATVFPLAEFVRDIGGERVEVQSLLPPGADVHTWQPRISEIRRLETADLLVFVGQGLEPWLNDLLGGVAANRPARFEAASGLRLRPSQPGEDDHDHDHGAFDPHVWLDFGLDETIADGLTAALIKLDPGAAAQFRAGGERLKNRLRELDAAYRRGLKDCRGRDLILAGHAAFSYLAARYGLRQIAVYGASPDAAPTPKITAGIIARAVKDGVRTIFFEPGLGDKMARLIAAEVGAGIRILYPGHNLSPAQASAGMTFFRLMEANLESLKDGLGCR
jgi:zinc transport system substrate-binding protein